MNSNTAGTGAEGVSADCVDSARAALAVDAAAVADDVAPVVDVSAIAASDDDDV